MPTSDKNPIKHITWCLNQKKGIGLEEPNDNLCKVYIQKAKSALNMLSSAIEKDEVDWIATTAHYARYFAFYALLQKCGITSEIHDCTISLLHFLFVEEKIIPDDTYADLQNAKELRIDTQYYAVEVDKTKLRKDAERSRIFVLNMEEVIEKITRNQITQLKKKLESARIKQ